MIIRENHLNTIKEIVFAHCAMILLWSVALIIRYNEIGKIGKIILYLGILFTLISFYFSIANEKKTIKISEKGIVLKWNSFLERFYAWEKINYVKIELVAVPGLKTFEKEAILCSMIPIRYFHYFFDDSSCFVLLDWCDLHIRELAYFYTSDLKEGQLEEFWSYVPERLKK